MHPKYFSSELCIISKKKTENYAYRIYLWSLPDKTELGFHNNDQIFENKQLEGRRICFGS